MSNDTYIFLASYLRIKVLMNAGHNLELQGTEMRPFQ